MRSFINLIVLAILTLGISTSYAQQAVLISPSVNNGGFESGPSNPSPWTIINTTGTNPVPVNKWYISTTAEPGFSGTYCAYISNSTSAPYAHTYTNSASSTVHLYQDVTFPAGQTSINLSFRARQTGETSWDRIIVYISNGAPAGTPVAGGSGTGVPNSNSTALTGYTQLFITPLNSGWTTYNITITAAQAGNATAASNRRILFVWQNDGSLGSNPPGAMDDVNLVAACPGGATPTSASAVTAATATVSWNTVAGATGYQVRYKKLTDLPTVGTWTTPVSVSGGTTSSTSISGLTASTAYEYQVAAVGVGCTDFSYSSNFTTACGGVAPPYLETFESITSNNTLPTCMAATSLGSLVFSYTATPASPTYNRTNHTPGGSKFASFRYGCNDWIFTRPLLLNGGQQYQFSFWYIADGLNGFNTLQAKMGTTQTAAGMTTTIGTPLTGNINNTTYQLYTAYFTPSATNTYYIGINCIGNSVPWYITIDDINVAPMCSGTPTAGTPSAPLNACAGLPFSLNLLGYTNSGNISFQWERSPAGANTWTNFGTNSPTQTPTQTVATDYRCTVTCNSPGGGSATSTVVSVGLNPFYNCYGCVPTYVSGGGGDNITQVTLKNLTNNTAGAGNPFPNYVDYTLQQPPLAIPEVKTGEVVNVSISFGTDPNQYSRVWIDFNHNSVFETSESFSLGTNAGANGTAVIPVAIPQAAVPGITRMRIRGGDDAAIANTQPCNASNSGWGEGEDYFINIRYAPPAPVLSANKNPICSGEDLKLNGTSSVNGALIAWYNPNSSFATFGNNYTIPGILTTQAGIYSAIVIQGLDTSFPATITITVNQTPATPVVHNDTACIGTPAQLLIDTVNGFTYKWYQAPGTAVPLYTGNKLTIPALMKDTTFFIQGTTSTTPCPTLPVELKGVLGEPPVVNLGNDTVVCANKPLTLNAYNPAGKYLWSTGATTSSIPVYLDGGDYWVSVDRYCVRTDTIKIELHHLPMASGINYIRSGVNYSFSGAGVQYADSYLWLFGDGSYSISPTPSHSFPTNNLYIVKMILINDCGSDTTIFYIPTDVQNMSKENDAVTLYPNPASSNITVSTEGDLKFEEITIINSLGAVVYDRKNEASKKQQVDISNFANGHYMMRVHTSQGAVSKPFDIIR